MTGNSGLFVAFSNGHGKGGKGPDMCSFDAACTVLPSDISHLQLDGSNILESLPRLTLLGAKRPQRSASAHTVGRHTIRLQ